MTLRSINFKGPSYTVLTNMIAERSAVRVGSVNVPTGLKLYGASIDYFTRSAGLTGISVPVKESSFRHFLELGYTSDIKSLTIEAVARTKPFIEVRLSDPSLLVSFGTFIDHLLGELSESTDDPEDTIIKVFDLWKQLFRPNRPNRLSLETQIGICSELEELYSCVSSQGVLALNGWYGPENERHDFEFTDRSIECKGTRKQRGLLVQINGTRQLEPTGSKPLELIVRQYDRDPNGEVSIPSLCSRLLEFTGFNREEFFSKLSRHDISPQDLTDLDKFDRFSRYGYVKFAVGDDFPRINQESLHPLICDMSYTLDLTNPTSIPGYLKGES